MNMPTVTCVLWDTKVFRLPTVRYTVVNEGTICGETGTTWLLFYCGDTVRIVTMSRSGSPQGQFSWRKALTVATTPGSGYLKRCRYKMRSELNGVVSRKSQASPALMWIEWRK